MSRDTCSFGFTEPQLEDWLWATGDIGIPEYRNVARQLRLPRGGIIDILGFVEWKQPQFVIIELKAKRAKPDHLVQVLYYAETFLDAMETEAHDHIGAQVGGWEHLWEDAHKYGSLLRPLPVLVAPSFNERMRWAAHAAGVWLYEAQPGFELIEQDLWDSCKRGQPDTVWPPKMTAAITSIFEEVTSDVEEGKGQDA